MSHHEHRHGRPHGNPDDLDAYVARMIAPDRDAWQRRDVVIAALRIRPGDIVADVGAGPGFFTVPLARTVGPLGRVYAVEVDPQLQAVLRRRVDEARVGNVTAVLGRDDDPLLPPRSCDAILVVNTFHHFPDGPAYLRRLASSLKPGGRIVDVDFHKRELPVGPPPEVKVGREEFLEAVQRAGLTVAEELTSLPYQYGFVLTAPGATRS